VECHLKKLRSFIKTYDDRTNVNQFIDTWPGNFMLQEVTPTTTIEATLKESARRVNENLYYLHKISDKDLMTLISDMRQLQLLLYVYNNQTRLLQSHHHINDNLRDFRNTILWTSDIMERHIIAKYKIQ
jgi:hypothetical protein